MPSLDEQHRIVDAIESELAHIDANRKLIKIHEKKIQDKLAEIWGDEEK